MLIYKFSLIGAISSPIELMIENPSIIKRPVLQIDNRIEIGFNAEQYAEIFG